jgi:predicted amidohydrolase YtcJ
MSVSTSKVRAGAWLLWVAIGLTATVVRAEPAQGAATLLEHVRGYTLAGGRLASFSALAFDESGRVIETGESGALRRRYPQAALLEGRGRTLLPGLIDAHGHVFDLGFSLVRIKLTDTPSLSAALERVAAYAATHGQEPWLLGQGWNQVIWKLGRFPLASELDAVVPDRPVVLSRIDGHAEWLNSKALALAGITHDTPDPKGGRIERDAAGNPAGVLVDRAMDLVDKIVPQPSDSQARAALQAALAHMSASGLTSVGDAGVAVREIALYRELADQGRLPVRIYAMIGGAGEDFQTLSREGPLIGHADDHLSVRSVKLFADGALGSRGAALLAPYSDSPDQRGLLFKSDAEMRADIETALKAGYQVNVHAIGDAANHQVLDAFEAAYREVGGAALRNRIEHAQVVAPEDIPRFKQLQLIASMQPTHATSDMNMAQDRIGPQRLRGAYAWRSFLDQGTRIAGGSDFPVESDNPFFGLYSAVTRADQHGQPRGGWHHEQAMTRKEALRAFTLDAAYAEHWEKSIGSLEPGKWADFILIDHDLFTMPVADIWKIKVEETWVAGRRVH